VDGIAATENRTGVQSAREAPVRARGAFQGDQENLLLRTETRATLQNTARRLLACQPCQLDSAVHMIHAAPKKIRKG
jgi:hypothetical protein